MGKPYRFIHSTCDELRQRIHVVLVRPEQGANVGSAARAIANMGIRGALRIVGTPEILDESARRLAKHALPRLQTALFFPTLEAALAGLEGRLALASTARIGSAHRPHPLRCDTALERAAIKLRQNEIQNLVYVFGPESDGLNNAEVELCDWVVHIPSDPEYRSLNLAQAVLLFGYETNRYLIKEWDNVETEKAEQKDKLIAHLLRLAEEVGFVLPGDPFKMRPRLEDILSRLPNQIHGIKTLHGWIGQTIRSVQKGEPDFKSRYRHRALLLQHKNDQKSIPAKPQETGDLSHE